MELRLKDNFMRYEKKFKISISDYPLLRIILKKFHFKEIYKSRFISSIYYDTDNFIFYKDSINGVSNRKKIRARYYNFNFSDINIEEKNKIADLGFKNIYPLKELKNLKKIRLFINNKKNLLIPTKINNIYYPVSFINYYRTYFISRDMQTRITLDEKINYSRIMKMKNSYSLKFKIPDF